MAAPLLTRRRILAAKVEVTPGTAESLAAADAQFHAHEVQVQPAIDTQQREGQAGLSILPAVPGAYGGRLTFQTDFHGDGASGISAAIKTLFLGCGCQESPANTIKPESRPPEASGSGAETLTLGVYEDGQFKRLRGCQGNARIVYTNGQRIRIEWEFTGLWEDPSDVALLAPTWPTVAPLRMVGATYTIGGVTPPPTQEFVFDLGNEVVLRESIAGSQGYFTALIVHRDRVGGTLNPESRKIADWNPYGTWTARTEQALVLTVNGGAGNTASLQAPKMQFTNVQEASRSTGLDVDDITYQLNRSASTIDSEWTLAWS